MALDTPVFLNQGPRDPSILLCIFHDTQREQILIIFYVRADRGFMKSLTL